LKLVLSVDPGVRGCGVALWRDDVLFVAEYVRNVAKAGDGGPRDCALMAQSILAWLIVHLSERGGGDAVVDVVALEFPQTYGGRAGRGDANDLISIAAVDGALAALFAGSAIQHYRPHDWKGSIKKPGTTTEPYPIRGRVEGALRPEELTRVAWTRNVRHSWDIVDALGVGLHFLGRFRPGRVYAVE
jgi:hypothetical protein